METTAGEGYSGGDAGIRTLDTPFWAYAPLAGECLRPLGHVSGRLQFYRSRLACVKRARDKFLAKRRELAEREWARLKANDSLECRNCHALASMDFTLQSPRAQSMHSTLLASGEKTCIDCHKGIAHHLPDMAGVPMVTQNWHEQMLKEELLEPWQRYIADEIGGEVKATN